MNPSSPKKKAAFSTSAGLLKRALEAVLKARGQDSSRPQLRKLFITVSTTAVMFEATDGHRLHRVRLAAQLGQGEWPTVALTPGQYFVRSLRALNLLEMAARAVEEDLGGTRMTVKLQQRLPVGVPTADQLAGLGKPKDPSQHARVKLNPMYVGQACEGAAVFGCSSFMLASFGAEDPVTISGTSFDDYDFTAIVMPIQVVKQARAPLSIVAQEALKQGIPVVLNPEAIGDPNATPIVQLPPKGGPA